MLSISPLKDKHKSSISIYSSNSHELHSLPYWLHLVNIIKNLNETAFWVERCKLSKSIIQSFSGEGQRESVAIHNVSYNIVYVTLSGWFAFNSQPPLFMSLHWRDNFVILFKVWHCEKMNSHKFQDMKVRV